MPTTLRWEHVALVAGVVIAIAYVTLIAIFIVAGIHDAADRRRTKKERQP